MTIIPIVFVATISVMCRTEYRYTVAFWTLVHANKDLGTIKLFS